MNVIIYNNGVNMDANQRNCTFGLPIPQALEDFRGPGHGRQDLAVRIWDSSHSEFMTELERICSVMYNNMCAFKTFHKNAVENPSLDDRARYALSFMFGSKTQLFEHNIPMDSCVATNQTFPCSNAQCDAENHRAFLPDGRFHPDAEQNQVFCCEACLSCTVDIYYSGDVEPTKALTMRADWPVGHLYEQLEVPETHAISIGNSEFVFPCRLDERPLIDFMQPDDRIHLRVRPKRESDEVPWSMLRLTPAENSGPAEVEVEVEHVQPHSPPPRKRPRDEESEEPSSIVFASANDGLFEYFKDEFDLNPTEELTRFAEHTYGPESVFRGCNSVFYNVSEFSKSKVWPFQAAGLLVTDYFDACTLPGSCIIYKPDGNAHSHCLYYNQESLLHRLTSFIIDVLPLCEKEQIGFSNPGSALFTDVDFLHYLYMETDQPLRHTRTATSYSKDRRSLKMLPNSYISQMRLPSIAVRETRAFFGQLVENLWEHADKERNMYGDEQHKIRTDLEVNSLDACRQLHTLLRDWDNVKSVNALVRELRKFQRLLFSHKLPFVTGPRKKEGHPTRNCASCQKATTKSCKACATAFCDADCRLKAPCCFTLY